MIKSLLTILRVRLINFILKGTNIMETVETLNAKIALLDSKLEEVRVFIAGLQAGQVITQEQIDALGAALDAEVAKADSLDEPQG